MVAWYRLTTGQGPQVHLLETPCSHSECFPKKEKMETGSLVSFLIDFLSIRRQAGPGPEVGAEGIHQTSTH